MPKFGAPLYVTRKPKRKKDALLLHEFTKELVAGQDAVCFVSKYLELDYIGMGKSQFLDHIWSASRNETYPIFLGILADIKGNMRLNLAYVNEYEDLVHLKYSFDYPPIWRVFAMENGIYFVSLIFLEELNGVIELDVIGGEFGHSTECFNHSNYIAPRKDIEEVLLGLTELHRFCYQEEFEQLIDDFISYTNNVMEINKDRWEASGHELALEEVEKFKKSIRQEKAELSRLREHPFRNASQIEIQELMIGSSEASLQTYKRNNERELSYKGKSTTDFDNEVKNLSKEIADRYKGLRENAKKNLKKNIKDFIRRVPSINIDALKAMNPQDFETFVAGVFKSLGYEVEVTQRSRDEGIDIIMKKGNREYCAQCKRHLKPIGQPVVRDFYGAMMNIGAGKGFIVTSGIFSLAAERFAEGKPIELIDGDGLLELMREVEK